jgi:hypothetical protein
VKNQEKGSVLESAALAKMWLAPFVDAGADVHAKDRWGQGLLHWVASSSRGATEIHTALTWCEEIDAYDREGNTPLMIAAYHGNAEVIEALLEAGADPGLYNEAGETALDIAVSELEKAHGSDRVAAAYVRQLIRKRLRWRAPNKTPR